MKRRSLLMGAATLCQLLFCAVAFAGEQPQLPTWPQSFSLSPGQKAEFGFPITQPGQVTIRVSWKGPALTMGLDTLKGRALLHESQRDASPTTLTYDATKADISEGVVLIFRLKSSQGGGVANGDIVVTAPSASLEKLKSALPPATPPNVDVVKASPSAKARDLSARVQARIASLTKAEDDRRIALGKQIAEKARLGLESYSKRMTTLRANTKVRLRPFKKGVGSPVVLKGKINPIKPVKDPAIVSLSPDTVTAGDRMTVNAANVTPSVANNVVSFLFSIQQGTQIPSTIAAKPVSATKLADGTTALEVIVPRPDNNWTIVSSCVFVTTNDHSPVAMTPAAAFTFVNDPIARMTSVAPDQAGPGDWQTIKGTNLKPDTEVHYFLENSREAIAQTQYVSPTQIRAQIPTYKALEAFNGYVYLITTTGNGSVVMDDSMCFILNPTAKLAIGSCSAAQGLPQGSPGDPVLINGTGFGQPVEVRFLMKATDPGMTADKIGGITDTQITTYVPDFSGVAKPVDGFIRVKVGHVESDLFPFRMVPATQYKIPSVKDFPYHEPSFDTGCGPRGNLYQEQYDLSWSVSRIWAEHTPSLYWGCGGTDSYFAGTELKNGWTVDNVDFGFDSFEGGGDASLGESHVGSSNPTVCVKWSTNAAWFNWRKFLEYYVIVTIKGPKGVPYNK